jgi:hypothetical protein
VQVNRPCLLSGSSALILIFISAFLITNQDDSHAYGLGLQFLKHHCDLNYFPQLLRIFRGLFEVAKNQPIMTTWETLVIKSRWSLEAMSKRTHYLGIVV